eukprot:1947514-Karenia_brevis.AAC.1
MQPEPDPGNGQQALIQQLQWQVFQLMQQNQFQAQAAAAAAAPEKPAPKPMYAAEILGKPIPDSR